MMTNSQHELLTGKFLGRLDLSEAKGQKRKDNGQRFNCSFYIFSPLTKAEVHDPKLFQDVLWKGRTGNSRKQHILEEDRGLQA